MPNEELEPSTPEAPAEAIPSTPEAPAKASDPRLNNAITEAKLQLLKDDPLAVLKVELEFAKLQQQNNRDKEEGRNDLERKRGYLAAWLVGIMAFSLIAFTILTVMDKFSNPNTRELITLFWTSQVGLVSSVVGYYFGAASKESK